MAGGPAEQLEQLIQTSLKQGVQRVFVDMRAVPVDRQRRRSRARPRAHLVGAAGTSVLPRRARTSRSATSCGSRMLEQVFTICDSVTVARAAPVPVAAHRSRGRGCRCRRRAGDDRVLVAACRRSPRPTPAEPVSGPADAAASAPSATIAALRARQARSWPRSSACSSRSCSATTASDRTAESDARAGAGAAVRRRAR